jgi:ABC-type branched-subunit amino acid transport system ATPase component
MSLLEIKALSKSFGIDGSFNLDFEVDEKEIVGLIGPNVRKDNPVQCDHGFFQV